LALATALAAPVAAVCGAGLWTAARHTGVPIRYWGGLTTGDARTAAVAAAIVLVLMLAWVPLARATRQPTEAAR
ncbi:MAG TPA: hypothetical protein VKB69_09490, partial [Micromonosporaceae bacterium]|nr:hypothetical protein [Micromonosporaceae bacterium]